MSSHHFVTETQSSALYICGRHIDENLLQQLLEWNPFIIGNYVTLEWLRSMDIRLDAYVSGGETDKIALPFNVEFWREEHLGKHLENALVSGVAERIVLAGLSSCELATLDDSRPFIKHLPVIIYTGNSRNFYLLKGRRFAKWASSDFRFAVRPASNAAIEGDVENRGDELALKQDGWLKIEALDDIIFTEFF